MQEGKQWSLTKLDYWKQNFQLNLQFIWYTANLKRQNPSKLQYQYLALFDNIVPQGLWVARGGHSRPGWVQHLSNTVRSRHPRVIIFVFEILNAFVFAFKFVFVFVLVVQVQQFSNRVHSGQLDIHGWLFICICICFCTLTFLFVFVFGA